MATKKVNKKTVEEGKNVKSKKANASNKKKDENTGKKTTERSDVNSDVDQE